MTVGCTAASVPNLTGGGALGIAGPGPARCPVQRQLTRGVTVPTWAIWAARHDARRPRMASGGMTEADSRFDTVRATASGRAVKPGRWRLAVSQVRLDHRCSLLTAGRFSRLLSPENAAPVLSAPSGIFYSDRCLEHYLSTARHVTVCAPVAMWVTEHQTGLAQFFCHRQP